MSWNAYPKYVCNSIINRLKSNVDRNDNINNNNDDRKVIWINLPYLGKKGEQLTNSLIRKLKISFKESVKLKTVYKTNKLSMFCNIYRIASRGCFQEYVGKTDQNLITRTDKHGTKVDQPMYQHLSNCCAFNDHIMLFTLPDAATGTTIVSKELHLHNVVINNVKILDKTNKWGQLQFLEAYYIKKLAPEINIGLTASKELQLFK